MEPEIILASGQRLKLQKVMLYPQKEVTEIAALKIAAAKAMGGRRPVLGAVGTPSWEFVGAALATAAASGLLASAIEKQAADAIQQAQIKSVALANIGRFFPAEELTNAHVPNPQAWIATLVESESRIDLSGMPGWKVQTILEANNQTKQNIAEQDGKRFVLVPIRTQYVHNGDEFVSVETDLGFMSLRWSHVVAYFPVQSEIAKRPTPSPEKRPAPPLEEPTAVSFREGRFPKGTTLYDASGVNVALLPDGSIMTACEKVFPSAVQYRVETKDSSHWRVIKEY
jgi:hypothetical protein